MYTCTVNYSIDVTRSIEKCLKVQLLAALLSFGSGEWAVNGTMHTSKMAGVECLSSTREALASVSSTAPNQPANQQACEPRRLHASSYRKHSVICREW